MKFSIVTPSFRQLAWLKRCIRSIEDQAGVEVEHIVQDAVSGPELEQWVRGNSRAQLFVERDNGMYDAINRGFARSTGELCAYLNCDEQYLPGALMRVERAFAEHPEVDIFVGDCLVVDARQELLAYRRVTPLRRSMIQSDHLYANSCTLFFRRRLLEDGMQFNSKLKTIGDQEWVCEALERGYRTAIVHEYLATFTWTGENLGAKPVALAELGAVRKGLPIGVKLAAPFLRQWRHVERLLLGGYTSGPIEYSVYRDADDESRTTIRCERPSFRYPGS
jgi:glycosyltransferase involved in cell wall biosynthesis